jgi:hypothetical protein
MKAKMKNITTVNPWALAAIRDVYAFLDEEALTWFIEFFESEGEFSKIDASLRTIGAWLREVDDKEREIGGRVSRIVYEHVSGIKQPEDLVQEITRLIQELLGTR